MQKGPQQNRRKRSGPPATTRLPTASHLAGRHATTGKHSHLEGMASKNQQGIEAKEGCPRPIEPGRGDETHVASSRRGELLGRNRPPQTPPRPGTLAPPRSQRRLRRRNRQPERTNEARASSDLPPRHHGRPGRRPHPAPPLPPSLATTARQERRAAEYPGRHGQLLRRLLEAPTRRQQVVELQKEGGRRPAQTAVRCCAGASSGTRQAEEEPQPPEPSTPLATIAGQRGERQRRAALDPSDLIGRRGSKSPATERRWRTPGPASGADLGAPAASLRH
jgi:hypothetical protein